MLYLHEVSSLHFHSRDTGRWCQGPALSLSACEPASLSSPLFLKTCPFQLSMWNQIACQYPRGETAARFLSGPEMKRQRETIWGRQRSTRSPFSVAANPVSLWLSKCNRRVSRRGKRAHSQRRKKKNLPETMSETILGLWLINKKLLVLQCRKWMVSPGPPPVQMQINSLSHPFLSIYFGYN